MKTPSVLTIVLNYRTPELSVKAAEAALREMEGIEGEVLIVDNDSQDGSMALIAEAAAARGWDKTGRLHIRASGHNGGFGAGNNFGILSGLSTGAAPDYVYILNSDAWPDPGAIRVLVDFLQAHPEAGVAGSAIRGEDGVPHQTAFRFPTIAGEFEGAVRTGLFTRLLRRHVIALPIPAETAQVDWVAGASAMLRRSMLDQIGLFDESYFLYYEETDLCLRARRAGWRAYYLPASRVVHVGSVSTGMKTWARTPRYWFDSRMHYFTKNHGAAYAAAATLARIAGGAIWALRRRVSHKPQQDPDGFLPDLIRHALRAPFVRRSSPAVARRDKIIEGTK